MSTTLLACAAPSYYFQAASGHFELMRQSEDIGKLLADDATEPEIARQLELAQEVRGFAIEHLGLPDSGGYETYAHTGREAVTWNVVAAPEFSLEPKTWCFLVAGCVPYRGYFKQTAARKFAGKLDARGYDTAVAPATAYSTLGWFEDPLLDTMFGAGDAALAGTLFHEMAHRQLYVKGDTAFNESFATFVEETGVERWLISRSEDPQLESWRTYRRTTREINELLVGFRARLEDLYAATLPENEMRTAKRRVLDQLCLELDARTGRSSEQSGCAVNNASLALRSSYHGGTCAFDTLYQASGGDMELFLEQAALKAELPRGERQNWLNGPCAPVAPEDDL